MLSISMPTTFLKSALSIETRQRLKSVNIENIQQQANIVSITHVRKLQTHVLSICTEKLTDKRVSLHL